ncbi:MAG TPA: TRAM domain-containing protein [Rectinemataceae bacterium]|nr:TRAM domain-containing protein [Rectinemataceae bacterium]
MAGDRIILTVEKLASGGDGIAFHDGRAVFVPLSIPGEKVLCEITETSKDYSRARILDILDASPFRTEPPCPIFGLCGGCSLQHIDYSRQLELKTDSVREAFKRIAKFDPGKLTSRPSSPYGYRNRAQFHFTDDHGIGFMEAESASSVRAEGCPVAVGVMDAWLRKQNRKSRPDKDLRARIGARDRFVVFGQDDRLYIEGQDAQAKAVVAGREYRFPLKHFFQSNLEAADALLKDALSGLSGGVAVDLYSGAGLFAAGLALQFDKVICVESDTVSLEAARGNVPAGAGEFHPTDVESWAQAISARTRCGETRHYDWILADPPRSGLSPATREWLKNADQGGFTYVSCDHVTMARDIGDLLSSGWRLETLALYDFYPQTGRIEALARLLPPKQKEVQGG